MTNCKNCGAILHGNKCEYCGTEYPSEETEEYETLYAWGEPIYKVKRESENDKCR